LGSNRRDDRSGPRCDWGRRRRARKLSGSADLRGVVIKLIFMRPIRGVGDSFRLTLLGVAGNFCPMLFVFFAPVGVGGRSDRDDSVRLGLGGAAAEIGDCSV
jgi:hypothetical protein